MNRPLNPPLRSFKSLRVSLGSACDLACDYCAPDHRLSVLGELAPQETAKLVRLLANHLSLTKLRITGGEPLLGNRLERFLSALGQGLEGKIGLTTNGQMLEQKIPLLLQAGIRRVNVSLDSLQPASYARITAGGDLRRTLAGLAAAKEAGLQVKINMIPQRNRNEEEILPLLEWACSQGFELRFIELMRMGTLSRYADFAQRWVGLNEILKRIQARYLVRALPRPSGATAQGFEATNLGRFGVIANESAPFCADCDRLRLTPKGELIGCLSSETRFDLKPLLAHPDEASLSQLLDQALAEKQEIRFLGSRLEMMEIGG